MSLTDVASTGMVEWFAAFTRYSSLLHMPSASSNAPSMAVYPFKHKRNATPLLSLPFCLNLLVSLLPYNIFPFLFSSL